MADTEESKHMLSRLESVESAQRKLTTQLGSLETATQQSKMSRRLEDLEAHLELCAQAKASERPELERESSESSSGINARLASLESILPEFQRDVEQVKQDVKFAVVAIREEVRAQHAAADDLATCEERVSALEIRQQQVKEEVARFEGDMGFTAQIVALVEQLKGLSPKVIEHERLLRSLPQQVWTSRADIR